MAETRDDHYSPWRTSVDAMRLSYQHFVWREHLQYNLHPSIKLPETSCINIADIATGHCLWALQVADTLGPDCQIDASDLSLDLCPGSHLLPPGMTLRHWNFFDRVPAEWLGKFDIVHVRLIVAAFQGAKQPRLVLEKLVSMLKPGGYLQWDEYEYSLTLPCVSYNAPLKIPTPSVSHPFAMRFYHTLVSGFEWPLDFFDKLNVHFSEVGLIDVVCEKKEQKHSSVVRAFHEYFVTFCEQMAGVFQKVDSSKAEELDRLLGKIVEAARTDGVLCSPIPKVVVGRKPLESQ